MPASLRRIPHCGTITALLLASLCFGAKMSVAQTCTENSGKPLDPESKQIAVQLWKKILTNCDGDYYYGGSDFEPYIFGPKTGGAARANRGLTKYSGVHFLCEAMPISVANAAEGVQRKGLTAMLPERWRERIPNENQWGDPITPKSGADLHSLGQILMTSGHLGSAGAMTVEIWQVKEQWYYVLPPETVPERQLIPVDKIGRKEIACGPLKNGGAGFEPPTPLFGGPAVTTRDLTDLKPNVPPDCEIPKGTEVTIERVYPDTGKVDVFIPGSGKRAGRQCPNNFLKNLDRADVEPKRLNAGKPVGVVAANVTETEPKSETHGTVIGDTAKLMARPGSDATFIANFPNGTRVRIVGYEDNAWLRVNIESNLTPQQQHQAKYSPSHGIFGGYMDAKNVKIDGQ